jgi:hypothetical protein
MKINNPAPDEQNRMNKMNCSGTMDLPSSSVLGAARQHRAKASTQQLSILRQTTAVWPVKGEKCCTL